MGRDTSIATKNIGIDSLIDKYIANVINNSVGKVYVPSCNFLTLL